MKTIKLIILSSSMKYEEGLTFHWVELLRRLKTDNYGLLKVCANVVCNVFSY